MISEKDLQGAIADCLNQRNPSTSTCINLAAFLTVQDHLYGKKELPSEDGIQYSGESEFAKIVMRKSPTEVLTVMDELMQTLECVNPRLYACVIRKLQERA